MAARKNEDGYPYSAEEFWFDPPRDPKDPTMAELWLRVARREREAMKAEAGAADRRKWIKANFFTITSAIAAGAMVWGVFKNFANWLIEVILSIGR